MPISASNTHRNTLFAQHRHTREHIGTKIYAHYSYIHSPSNNNLIPLGISVSRLPADVIGLQFTQIQTKENTHTQNGATLTNQKKVT